MSHVNTNPQVQTLMSLEEYCAQTVKDLISTSGLAIEANTSKVIVLGKAASLFHKKGMISDEVLKTVTDDRFVRLSKAKVRDLQKLLTDKGVPVPKQGKSKLSVSCYNLGLDVPITSTNNNSNNSSDDSGGLTSNESDDMLMVEGTDETFSLKGRDLYFGANKISNEAVLHLVRLLLQR
jgi:hypothetical protein